MSVVNKHRIGIILLLLISINTSCNDKNLNMRFCEKEEYRAGEVYAESNLRSFDGFALYSLDEDSNEVSVEMGQLWDAYCGWNEFLDLWNLNVLKLNDTIYLNHVSENGYTAEFPTANYSVYDHDSPLFRYKLLTDDSVSDWVYLESYNSESELITGSFQASLKLTSSIDTSVNNSYPPRMIFFKNGSFEAHAWPTY